MCSQYFFARESLHCSTCIRLQAGGTETGSTSSKYYLQVFDFYSFIYIGLTNKYITFKMNYSVIVIFLKYLV